MKRYKHPNPLFSDVSMTEDGRYQKHNGAGWVDVESPISIPVAARKSVTREGEDKALHRFAYECFTKRELPSGKGRIVFISFFYFLMDKAKIVQALQFHGVPDSTADDY